MPKPTVDEVEDHDDDAGDLSRTIAQTESPDSQPLRSLSRDGASDEVINFAEANNLMHKLDVFEKAAALLQGDIRTEQVPNITIHEVKALQTETERKWSQPKMLYLTVIVCSLGAIEQGWAQTCMNGANLYFPKAFGIDSDSPKDNFVVGLINSGIYLSVGILGAWLAEPTNRRLGRRGTIFLGSSICLVSNIASAFSQSWPQLLAFRFLLGIGLALDNSTISIFVAECAPPAIRGGLAVSWQMMTALGLFIGFVANVAVYDYGDNTWRLQLAAPLIPVIPLMFTVFLCPESPSWLIKKSSRYDKAFLALRRLRNTELQAAKELYATYLQRQAQEPSAKKPSYPTQIRELLSVPRIRRATTAAYTVMLCQQLCGINIIAFYSSTIFSDAGFTTYGALLASCVFGLLNFLFAFPAVWTMDTLGRRSLLLLTLPIMAVTMLFAGLSFLISTENPAHFYILASMIYLFCVEYSPGMGPVPNVYAAEVFPLSHREVGMSSSVAVASIWATVLSFTFPRLLTALKPIGAFELYAFLNIVAVILVFLFVPETRQKSLDELDEVFSISSRSFIVYQTMEYLPWFVKRYVLRQKQVDLRPLDATSEYRKLDQDEEEHEEDRL